MSACDFRIYAVDDEPLMLELIESVFSGCCGVEVFSSAAACLARSAQQAPGMFLLDVRMPGMDGYALCRALKERPETADIPVTFVSAYDTIEARLAGYEAGGEDFIVKPFEPAELMRKVQVAQHIGAEKRQLREMAGCAQRTAFAAMTSMGELGVVLEFLRRSYACADARALARAILDALGQYGLDGAVQVRLLGDEHCLSASGSDLPLETSILNHVRDQGRIFEFKSRSVYNYGAITLLVKNMPLDDAERCGRIRDNLAILAEGADARCQALAAEAAKRRAHAGIDAALARIQTALDGLRRRHQNAQCEHTQLLVEIQEGLMSSFISLGLTEGQENAMVEFVRSQFERLRGEAEGGAELSEQLEGLARDLKQLTG